MKRILISLTEELSEDHREKIRAKAKEHGFLALFFDDVRIAEPFLKEAEILFSPDPAHLALAPKVKWIATPFAGIDRFTSPGLFDPENVLFSGSSGAYGITISEHVIMMILEILRRAEDYRSFRKEKRWKRDLPVRSIYGVSIMIVGTGDVGSAIAKRLRAFEPEVILGINQSLKNPGSLFDRVYPSSSLTELLPETDILILTLPGTSKTFHMIGDAQLCAMKDDALLINVGRGSVVDEAALIRHLESGRLYAGLDVFETEPLPETNPLYRLDRALITPHCSGNMTLKTTVDLVVDQFLEDFERYCNGLPLLHAKDVKRGY